MELIGLEPTTSSLRTKRSPKLSYSPEYTANREKDKLSPAFGGILKVAATHYVRGQLWDYSPEYTANREKDKLSPAFGEILKVAATHCVRGQLWDYSPEIMADCQRSMDNGQ